MKSLALGSVYVVASGLVVLAVESYDMSPSLLILMALAGVSVLFAAVFRKDSE